MSYYPARYKTVNKFASRIELSAGIGTVVLAVVSSAFFIIATKSSEVEDYLLYIVLAIVVAIGSYFHVIRGRITGLVILLLSGLTLAGMALLGGVIFYARGSWRGLPVILPCVSAAVAVVAAILATKARDISG